MLPICDRGMVYLNPGFNNIEKLIRFENNLFGLGIGCYG